jgi:hypothetical protein
MVENDGDDNIFFNKQNLPKIITITKEKTLKDKKPESIIIINKGSNKIHLNLKNKSNKINREDIMDSLKMIKKIQLESVDDYYGKNKLNISSYKFIKSCQKKLLIIGNKDDMKKKKYDNDINPNKIHVMKKRFLKKEEVEILSEDNYNKSNTSELFQKNIDTKLYGSKQSVRISLQSSNYNNSNCDSNKNSECKYYNKRNYSEIIKDINTNLGKRINLNKNIKELTRNKTVNLEKMNSTNLITNILNIVNSTKSFNDKANLNPHFDKCLICERKFSVMNLCCSECNIHFFCRKCLKYYCRELIEKGIKKMKCPITNCNYNIYEQFLKSVLSKEYRQLLLKKLNPLKSEEKTTVVENDISRNKYKIFNTKIKHSSEDKSINIRLYNNKHVIDVNSNMMLYKVRKYKNEYCLNCHEPTLFCKIDTIFHKCLNCGFKVCKYCNKEYTKTHLIINYPGHCKVYYKKKEDIEIKRNNGTRFLIQLLYTLSMFYIIFAFCYLSIYNFFKEILKITKNNKSNIILLIFWRIKDILNIIISIILFVTIFPFLFIWTPFFPVIISLIDGF